MPFAPLVATLGATSLLALPAASAEKGAQTTFSLSAAQAREVSLTVQFITAFNGRRFHQTLALLTQRVSVSDCDYKNVRVVSLDGRQAVGRWLRQRFADHDRLIPARIYDENPDQPFGVVGVEYSRRTSDTLRRLGFPKGIVPKLASKVGFATQPLRIRAFANGPYGGDPNLCRPSGP